MTVLLSTALTEMTRPLLVEGVTDAPMYDVAMSSFPEAVPRLSKGAVVSAPLISNTIQVSPPETVTAYV